MCHLQRVLHSLQAASEQRRPSQRQKFLARVFHLKGVVLRGDLLDEVVADHGDLLHDVVANLGNIGEEEEGEDSCDGTEATEGDATVEDWVLVLDSSFRIVPMHPVMHAFRC